MAIIYEKNNLVLGRGRVFFEKFDSQYGFTGSGLRYIGNTDLFNITINRQRTDVKGSRNGLLVLMGSEVSEESCTGVMTTDNLNRDNVQDWFSVVDSGIPTSGVPAPQTVVAERGRYYQVGVTPTNPAGLRNLLSVTVTKGGTTVVQAGNYEVDLANGMIRILSNAVGIADGDSLVIGGAAAVSNEVIMVPTGRNIRGALRFVSNSTVGTSRDVFIPAVELRPDGDQEFKGDKWQELRFTFAATYRPKHELYYVMPRVS